MDILLRVLLNFLNWGEPRFRTKVNHIVTAMTTEPMLTLLPNPLPTSVATRVAALAALTDYNAAEDLAADGSKAAIADRKEKRAILEEIMKDWAPVLELAAKQAGSIAILENSGYDLRHMPQPVPQPPARPAVKLKQGRVSGLLIVHGNRPKGVVIFETQRCTSDPAVEANWNSTKQTTGCRHIEFPGCTPGQLIYVRMRAIGNGGPSDWSEVVSLIVI